MGINVTEAGFGAAVAALGAYFAEVVPLEHVGFSKEMLFPSPEINGMGPKGISQPG